MNKITLQDKLHQRVPSELLEENWLTPEYIIAYGKNHLGQILLHYQLVAKDARGIIYEHRNSKDELDCFSYCADGKVKLVAVYPRTSALGLQALLMNTIAFIEQKARREAVA